MTVKEQLMQKIEEFKQLLEQAECDGEKIMSKEDSVRKDMLHTVDELAETVGYYVDN